MKKLYFLYQDVNSGYDTYDSMVVCAKSEDNARVISPSSNYKFHDGAWYFQFAGGTEEKEEYNDFWCDPVQVKVREIGIADQSIEENSIICSSFNPG